MRNLRRFAPSVVAALLLAFATRMPAQADPPSSFGCLTLSGVSCQQNVSGTQLHTVTYTTSWLGNTLPGANGQWAPTYNAATAVGTDGTVYYSAFYDENAHEAGSWKNGVLTAWANDLHGFSRSSAPAIANDGTYTYVGMTQGGGYQPGVNNVNGLPAYPPSGTTWNSIQRYTKSMGNSNTLSGGYGWNGGQRVLSVVASPTPLVPIGGMALGSGNLYASDAQTSTVFIFKTPTLATPVPPALASFSLTNPGSIAVDPATGNVWIANIPSGTYTKTFGRMPYISGPTQISEFTSAGVAMSGLITLPTTSRVGGMCINPAGNLVIADQGTGAQDFEVYGPLSSSSPTLLSTIGAVNGVFSGTAGQVGPMRFNMPNGCGWDSAGNFYAMGGIAPAGSWLEAYNSGNSLLWGIYGHSFVDAAAQDPVNGDIYTNHEHYHYSSAPATPGTEATWVGETVNPFAYPHDPRIDTFNISQAQALAVIGIRYISGHKFLYGMAQQGGFMPIYKFGSDEIARPAMIINGYSNASTAYPTPQPTNVPWDWTDTSGTGDIASGTYVRETADTSLGRAWGWMVDTTGVIWKAMENGWLRSYPPQGVDANGNPEYTYASSVLTQIPSGSGLAQLERAVYVPSSDTMYLAGYPTGTTDDGCWGNVGKQLDKYTSWSTSPTLAWTMPIPFQCAAHVGLPKSIDVAGNYVFIDEFQSNSLGTSTATYAQIDIYDAGNGTYVGSVKPGPMFGSFGGDQDETNSFNVVSKTANDFDAWQEEDARNKIVIYHIHIQ